MLSAKPLRVFSLGLKKIVVCQVAHGDALQFLDQELSFYAHGDLAGHIRIEGVSTASDDAKQEFDFSYSGDEIRPEQLGDGSVITDGRVEEALRALTAA
jgi:hypothetical protein